MLQVLLDHWEVIVQIIVVIGATSGLYYRMQRRMDVVETNLTEFEKDANEHWARQEVEFGNLAEKFTKHEADPLPHKSCPAHAQALADIVPRLDRIQADIGNLREDVGSFKTSLLTIVAAGKK
jgi:hypothetical protein